MMSALTFAHLREQNLQRCRRWHPDGAPPWTFDDWLLALGGEVGEALNVVKKLNRDRDGLAGNTRTRADLVADLAGELADVVIYLDICLGWESDAFIAATNFHEVRSLRRYTDSESRWFRNHTASELGNAVLRATGNLSLPFLEPGAIAVFTTVDRLADHFDIDLGAAVVAKFNATSEKFGFPERLVA